MTINSSFRIIYLFWFAINTCSCAYLDNQHENPAATSNTTECRNILHSFSYSEASLCGICDELLGHIGMFLINPISSLGSINQSLSYSFRNGCSLKFFVNERFHIREFANVDKNEKEFAIILDNLTWCCNDPYLLFSALIEDITSCKKPFKVLFRPLISYLVRTFKELSQMQQANISRHIEVKFKCNLENQLANICARNGHYDLAFDFLEDDPKKLIWCFSELKNWENLMNFFKSNPIFALKYQNAFELSNINVEHMCYNDHYRYRYSYNWIATCIIKAPEIIKN